ncbi:MAG: TOBE domain-containing protein [Candidatus Bathyarchaeota archaeon]|nr:TOBE domain-containing protein [Candidatus Bathyarchaeota archaeon]
MMLTHKKHQPSCKVWIECDGKPVIGKGGAEILQGIQSEKSLTKAAEKVGMSYRYVWNYIQKIEKAVGEPIVNTYKGGKTGGGGAELTDLGKKLLAEYKQLEGYLSMVLSETDMSGVKNMKLSARNSLKGKVVSVEKGVITAKVKVELTVPTKITSVITKEAVEDLDIKEGDEVTVVVKSTEVMIGK